MHAVHGTLILTLGTLAAGAWGAHREAHVQAPTRIVHLSGEGVHAGWYDAEDLTSAVRRATWSLRTPQRVDRPVADGDSLIVHGGWLLHEAASSIDTQSPVVEDGEDGAHTPEARPGPSEAAVAALAMGKPLSLNHATAADLESLPGIGPSLARRIVEGRPYRTLADLDRVKGIGPKKLASLRTLVTP